MNDLPSDERFPVWDALSEFFLDTELDKKDLDRIVGILSNSAYSVKDIEDILYFEVYPACKWNMFCLAVEWASFDPDWIMENIAPRKDKRSRFSFVPVHRWMFQRHWSPVAKAIEARRQKIHGV